MEQEQINKLRDQILQFSNLVKDLTVQIADKEAEVYKIGLESQKKENSGIFSSSLSIAARNALWSAISDLKSQKSEAERDLQSAREELKRAEFQVRR